MERQDEEKYNKNTTQYGLHTTMHKQAHLAQIMLFLIIQTTNDKLAYHN